MQLNTVDIVVTYIKGTVCVICSDPPDAISRITMVPLISVSNQ